MYSCIFSKDLKDERLTRYNMNHKRAFTRIPGWLLAVSCYPGSCYPGSCQGQGHLSSEGFQPVSHALSLNNTCIHVHASIILVHYSPLDLCHARPLTDDISSSNCASRFCFALTTSEGARRSLPAESLAKPEPGSALEIIPGAAAVTPSCCARCGGINCPLPA